MKKTVIFLGDGFEEIEALTVVDVLRRGNIDIKSMSLKDTLSVEGSHNIKITSDMPFDYEYAKNCDMIILPGGLTGTNNLKNHTGVIEILEYFVQNNKNIAAICAAPSILGEKNYLNGKKALCYPNFEKYLFGAELEKNKNVVTDGIFTTSRGPATSMEFALKLLEILNGDECSKNVAKGMLFI